MQHPQWLARIDVPGHPAAGSGLLVADRTVVTWAKVLHGQASAEVTLLDGQGARPAQLVFTAGSPTRQVAETTGELVLLELESAAGCPPAWFAPYHALEIYADCEFAIARWPEKADRPDQTIKVTADSTAGVAAAALTATGAHAPDGPEFLGAAVYHPFTHRVVGLAVDAQATRMVPTGELVRLHGLLADMVDFRPLGPAAYRELLEILRPMRLDRMQVSRLRSALPTDDIATQASSAVALAEALVLETAGEPYEIKGLLTRFLFHVVGLDKSMAGAVRAWHDRYLWDGTDPEVNKPVPRRGAIVVQLAPTADGDDETYEMTVWTADQLDGGLDRPVVTTPGLSRDQVQAAVEAALPRALATMPIDVDLAFVEFVLARDWLAEPVDEWPARFDDDTALGLSKPVTVRDLDWVASDQRELRRRVLAVRADRRGLGAIMQWRDCVDPLTEPTRFKAWLRRPDDLVVGLGLTGEWARIESIWSAVRSGVPLMVWSRAGCPADHDGGGECPGRRFRAGMVAGLLDVGFDQVAERMHRLRIAAVTGDGDQHCGGDVTLLRDDGQRRPMDLELVPLDAPAW